MSLDYCLQGTFSEDDKSVVSNWIKKELDDMAVENDDVFVQYIMVMISSGKTMGEISGELEAFLGNPESEQFTEKLSNMLKPIENAKGSTSTTGLIASTDSSKRSRQSASQKSSKNTADKNSALDTPLSSSRGQQQKAPQGRLIQSALKSTLKPPQPSSNKRQKDSGIEVTSTGFTTNKRSRPSGDKPQQRHVESTGMPGMGMFDPSMMAQQMDSYAQMMGFESSAAMMEFYNMSMMSMMQSGHMNAPHPPGSGRWPDGGGRFRGRGPPRGGFRGGRFGGGAMSSGVVPNLDISAPPPQPAVQQELDPSAAKSDSVVPSNDATEPSSTSGYPTYGGYRGRGWGRGRNSYYDSSRGRFGGRGAMPFYAPRGRGGPIMNKTWTRQSDMESGLVAER